MRTAREISAKLIPHTTSVHNVDVIKEALLEARCAALEEAAKIADEYECNEDCTAAILALMEAKEDKI